MEIPLYKAIAREIARSRSNNPTHAELGAEALERLESHLPSGSGLDLGPRIDDRSRENHIVISHCDFHHMSEHGFYDGWTEHTVVITPSLAWGIDVRVTGRDRNEIKEYIGEIFHDNLTAMVPVKKSLAAIFLTDPATKDLFDRV